MSKKQNRPKMKIKEGDLVEVIAGNDRGARGRVTRVLPKKQRVVGEGVNIRKKHLRPIQANNQEMQPGIIQFEAPIHVSNVMLVDPNTDRPTRVSIRRDEEGFPVRVARVSGKDID
ncbi:MAG: 50S ribosomal protein L24 [Anaerolineae bacterium]